MDPATEECDDGNAIDTDDCIACRENVCGDGEPVHVAGNGRFTEEPRDGPALEAALGNIDLLALDHEDRLHIGAEGRLWRLDAEAGTLTRVAGAGPGGPVGDFRHPLRTSFSGFGSVAFLPDGDLLAFAEVAIPLVRRIGLGHGEDGIVRTIAGLVEPPGGPGPAP